MMNQCDINFATKKALRKCERAAICTSDGLPGYSEIGLATMLAMFLADCPLYRHTLTVSNLVQALETNSDNQLEMGEFCYRQQLRYPLAIMQVLRKPPRIQAYKLYDNPSDRQQYTVYILQTIPYSSFTKGGYNAKRTRQSESDTCTTQATRD